MNEPHDQNRTVDVPADALDAGLAAAFGKPAEGSRSSLDASQRPVLLREAKGESDHIVKPNSDAMPPKSETGDRYQLFGEIARGGMGAVLRGRDVDLGRDLAVKILLEKHADRPEVARRFLEEAQIGGQLQHPGVVPVYDIGRFGERPFFTMKLVKGQTLAMLLAERNVVPVSNRHEPLPAGWKPAPQDLPRLLDIALKVAQALAYAHAKGVIHRDLKPANIMVGAFGEVQVMDWGLAKVLAEGGIADEEKASRERERPEDGTVIRTARSSGKAGSHDTEAGSLLGTPAYMPPEQANGDVAHLDRRADVFGLGAILCEILTGQPPYVGRSSEEVRRKSANGDLAEALARLDACGADTELIVLTKTCLSPEARDRPKDAQVRNLQAELDQEEKDRQLLDVLDEARLAQAETVDGKNYFVWERAIPKFREVLLAYGMPPGKGRPAAVAARIRDRPARVRETLLAALAEWIDLAANPTLAIIEPHLDWLRAVLIAAEAEDIWTGRFRETIQKKDVLKRCAALKKLAAQADVGNLPAHSLTWLAAQLESVEAHARAVRLLRQAREQYPADFWVNHDLGRALLTTPLPEPEEAVRFLTTAVALRPESAGAYNHLGHALQAKGQLDEAIACYQKAIALGPKLAVTHSNLGTALHDKGQLDEAIACYHKAIALDPKFAKAYYNLGNALYGKGQVDGPIACFQKVIELDPQNAEAHCNLGHARKRLGNFAEAVKAMRRGHELGMKQRGWGYPSAEWVRQAEGLAALEAKLPAFLKGESQPRDTAEFLEMAYVCQVKKLHHPAARLYVGAFAAEPKTAADLQAQHRYNAACSAALAAAGQSEDATKLETKERVRLRQQTLDWLRADLAQYAKLVASGPPAARSFVQQRLRHWQKDSDLAGIRDQATLAKLSTEERTACTQLWADVAALGRKAQELQTGKLLVPVHEIGKGLELRGQLDRQTPTLIYQAKLTAGKTYVIDLVSPDEKALDPYLMLSDASGKTLAEDDDSGGNLNARIVFRAEQTGTYRLHATSFNQGAGAFILTVRDKAPPPKEDKK